MGLTYDTREGFVEQALNEIASELHKRCHRRMLFTIRELRAAGTLEHQPVGVVDFRQLTEDANDGADRILENYLASQDEAEAALNDLRDMEDLK